MVWAEASYFPQHTVYHADLLTCPFQTTDQVTIHKHIDKWDAIKCADAADKTTNEWLVACGVAATDIQLEGGQASNWILSGTKGSF